MPQTRTDSAKPHMRLGAFMRPVSIHTAAWRYPGGTPDANFNLAALTRYAQLEAGYGHFFHGDYIASSLSAATHGSRDADYVYAQLTVNF